MNSKLHKNIYENDLYFKTFYTIECGNLISKLYNNSKIVLLDLRNLQAYKSSHIYGAIHFPINEINKNELKFNEYTSKDNKYWGALFDPTFTSHCELILYDNNCDIIPDYNITTESKDAFQFIFELFVIESDTYDKKPRNIFENNFIKKWRNVRILKGGFTKFNNIYGNKHCVQINGYNEVSANICDMNKAYNNTDTNTITTLNVEYEIEKDKLYLGNELSFLKFVDCPNLLSKTNIKCIIDMRKNPDNNLQNKIKNDSVIYLKFGSDNFDTNINNIISEIYKYIDDHKIYIFCETGCGISIAVIIAYLMTKDNRVFLDVFKEFYDQVKYPPIFEPNTFKTLIELERMIIMNKNNTPISICNTSFHPRMWYLCPYYEGSINTLIRKLCLKLYLKNDISENSNCIIS